MSKGKAVVSWEEELAAEAKKTAATERPSSSTISLSSGQMKLGDQPIPDNTLDCIIIGYIRAHVWYSEKYNPNKVVIPDCYALADGDDEEMAPHEEAPNPQHDGNCADCPLFQWESADNGRGKACKEQRRLIVLPADSVERGIAGSEMALLSVPPTSLKNWGNYVTALSATMQRPPWAVFTRIQVKPDPRTQFQVYFTALSPLDLDEDGVLSELKAKRAQALQRLRQPFRLPEEETVAAPTPARGKAAAKPATKSRKF